MAPVKFGDIPKVATAILDDDYVTSGYVLKTKQKTNFHGTSFSSQVNLFADDKCATPAKITFAMPKPFGCSQFSINKLEMDKSGKYSFEAAKGDVLPNFKVEVKSNLKDIDAVQICKTITPVPELQIKHDFPATKPQEFVSEVTYAVGKGTVGVKLNQTILSGGLPDFGARFQHGPMFGALTATKGLNNFDAAASFNVNPDLKVAMKCAATKKGFGSATFGGVYMGLYKAKVTTDAVASVAVKHVVAKGLTVQGGAQYNQPKGTYSFGVQLSVE